MKVRLACSIAVLLLAIWVVVPAPVYALLPLGVAIPEVSPALIVGGLVIGLLAMRSRGPIRPVVVTLSLVSVALASLPAVQFASARTRFNAATTELRAATTGRENDAVQVTRGLAFAEPEGRALTLDLYRSANATAMPVVIQIYGGAWRSGEPGDDAAFATGLARRGYLVAAIDYRHAPQSRWPAQINDVREAVEWVVMHASEYGGNPQLMALVGRSSGGQLALVEAYTDPSRFAGVIAYYAPTDLAGGWRRPPVPDPLPVRPVLENFLGGTPDTLPERYQAASPVTYVSKRSPATLLIYGARDHIVEPRFGRLLHDRLTAAGATGLYLELPWSEHAFDLVPGLGARLVQPYVERFLATYLR